MHKLWERRQKITHATCTESIWGSSWVPLAVLCLAVACVGCFAVNDRSGVTHESNLHVSWKSHLISRNPGKIFRKGKALFFHWTVRSQSYWNSWFKAQGTSVCRLNAAIACVEQAVTQEDCMLIELSPTLNKQTWFISEGTCPSCLHKWKLTGLRHVRFSSSRNPTNARQSAD